VSVRKQTDTPGRRPPARFERHRQFLLRRLSPSEAAGLTVTVGVAVVVALGLLFAWLLDDVLEGDGLVALDRPALAALAAHREPLLTTAVRVVTDIGGTIAAPVLAVLVGAGLSVARRSWLPLVVSVAGIVGIRLITLVVKVSVERDRPSLLLAVLGADGYSFPSGHTTGTTVVWLGSAWMLTHWVVHRRSAQLAVWLLAAAMTVAVGVSRVYLGVHYPTDVLAGWAVGGAWTLVLVLTVIVWENRRQRT
jgi:undecaprenyl-diphosphatase